VALYCSFVKLTNLSQVRLGGDSRRALPS
jgi:hypothetical protein